jgi:subtilisin inhibitor-like
MVMTIVYPIGEPLSRRANVTTDCPAGARCSTVRLNVQVSNGVRPRWARRVEQRLTCEPAGGTYSDPAAACRALMDLRKLMRNRAACLCALSSPNIRPRAVGTIRGRRVQIDLDGCTLCGVGGNALQEVRVLMPQSA